MGFNAAAPWKTIKLTKFGGLFTDVDPRNLPPGGSPLAYDADFVVSGVTIRPGQTSQIDFAGIQNGLNFLYQGSFSLQAGLQANLFQDSTGTLWQENLASEGSAAQIYAGILNGARTLGAKVNQRAYLTLSNLLSGTDQPRQWDGTNLDRISQVGPGQAPSAPILGDTGGAIQTVYQAGIAVDIYNAIWGSTLWPNSQVPPGSYLFLLFAPAATGNLNGMQAGDSVYLEGLPLIGGSSDVLGQNANGTYRVVSTGTWNGSGSGIQEWFAVQTNFSQGAATATNLSGATYQLAESALVIAPAAVFPLATAQSADAMVLAQTGLLQSNTAFPILRQPTVGSLSITNTALAADVATYTYALLSGWAPGWQATFAYDRTNVQICDGHGHVWFVSIAGISGASQPSWPASPTSGETQADGTVTWTYLPDVAIPVTVQNTANGTGGVFNVQQGLVTTAGPATFTVAVVSADVASAAESGATATSGSGAAFILDIGATTIGTGNPGTDPILGPLSTGVAVPVVPSSASGAAGQNALIASLQAEIASIQAQLSSLATLPQTAAVQNAEAAYRTQIIALTQQIATAESASLAGSTAAQQAANALQLTDVAPGQRYAICLFLTRNGFITPASPPVGFVTDVTTISVQFNNLPIGPPNVIARIVAITAANAGVGGPYYYVPQEVVTTSLAGIGTGAALTASATIVNDNTSPATPVFALSDTVLIASVNATTTGNNVQQQRELGECVKCVQSSGRALYMGERTKVDQFYNMTFDGGSVAGFPAGWTDSAGTMTVALIASPIFGQSLELGNGTGSAINSTGTSLADMDCISQDAYQTYANTPIIQPQNGYSARVTAWLGSAQTAGALVVELYSPGLAENWAFTIPFSSLTGAPLEFSGALGNPVWDAVPDDLEFRVYATNLAPGAIVYVDRIEPYPDKQPIYANQVFGSYAAAAEAIDAVTGPIDISNFTTDPVTNIFIFLDSFYISTKSRTFSVTQSASEPAFWGVNEISNAVGCLGPMGFAAGEEYALIASASGVYLFDGGNHIKISQDVQALWNLIYSPSAASIWIKNDIAAQRLYVGVPVAAPNYWMPNLAANAAPALPNAILMCNYLTAPTGAAIAGDTPVAPSQFTGRLIFHDERRKWIPWQIASPYGEFIQRADGSSPFWLCGFANSAVSLLDSSSRTDNGAAINQTYMTYDFSDEDSEQTLQLGYVRKNYGFASILVNGAGKFFLSTYPETPEFPYPGAQPPFKLANPAVGDTGAPLQETGNRCFLQFQADGAAGSWFSLNQIVLSVCPSRLQISGLDV